MLIGDRYELNEEIGAGGMGTVFRGVDTQTGMTVAIKSLKTDILDADPEIVTRFAREAKALSQLNHPNIVKVFDTLKHKDIHYIVMEYVECGSLRDILDKEKRLPVERVLHIMLDLSDALTRAHRLEIIHRDLKPANIMLTSDDSPRLTDFGVAHLGREERVTRTGVAVGTLDYISPETFNGEPVDKRTDIWAFGVMLYEMLVGERPFQGTGLSQIIKSILTDPIPDLETLRPDLPIALVDLIYRMLKRDQHARIPSVRLIGAELEALMYGRDTSTIQRVVVPDSERQFDIDTILFDSDDSQDYSIVPHNLPRQATPFVGRQNELESMDDMLGKPHIRLVTLLGPGGMGKTRLALESARENLKRFTDGVYFVPLAALDDSSLIVPTIAEHINFVFGGAEDHLVQLSNYLGVKRMLLVIDNFEHLLDAADVVSDILQHSPNVKIIVTSRERLRLRDEHVFEVRGMILPEVNVSPEEMQEYPVVKLFLQSAHRVMPDFVVNEETAPHIARICIQVQGLPLGIELAAAWLEMLAVGEIVDEIDNSYDFLETELRDVPERQRSIRAVFEYSWNLLREDERDTFMKLTVFKGGFEREAAQNVTKTGLRTLNSLINKSLLIRDPAGRYRLHTLLRQYAEEHLTQHPDRDEVHRSHAVYYARFVEKVEVMFNTKNEQTAVDMLEVELENVRAVWHWAVENQLWEPLEKVMYSTLLFHLGRSMLGEGAALFDGLASALQSGGQGDSALYWRARSYQAWLSNSLGDYELVWRFASGAFKYFDASGDAWAMSEALNNMSYVKMMQGDYGASVDYASQAITASEQPGVPPISWYMGMGNKGYAEFLRGNYDEACTIYEAVIAQSDHVDYSPTGNAYMLNNLGEIVRTMGNNERAHSLFNDAYKIFATHKLRRGMAFTLNNLAGIEFASGNHDKAKVSYLRGYKLNKEIGDLWGIGHSLSALGNTALVTEDYHEACKYFEESLSVRREMGQQQGIGDSLIDLARVASLEGDYEVAKTSCEESLINYREIGDKFGIVTALLVLSGALIGLNMPDESLNYVEEAQTLGQDFRRNFILERVTAVHGEIALMKADYKLAEQQFTTLLQAGVEMTDSIVPAAIALSGFAEIFAQRGDKVRALELASKAQEHVSVFSLYAPYVGRRNGDLLQRLTSELPVDVVKAAQNRTESRDVRMVAEELLQEIKI